ncbi:MAG: DUF4863 family protein [Myxococcales bacterium]|nr:DUF4863 family protein [Myxococcales bacterium]MCB9705603.1 DUF4863 family protein [Myxococcales bacterium]
MIAAAADVPSLIELLAPLLAKVAALRPESRDDDAAIADLEAELADAFPIDGELVQAIGASLERGVAEGWLCDRGEPDARFSRVARASAATHDLSIDVVRLAGAALRHRHPRGEVTLGFAVEGEPRFCGRVAGWIFAGPGSTHVPEVNAGRMNLIYFLPGGAVEWNPPADA